MCELARVAAPGGTIIIVTWCHRDLKPGEESLQPWELTLLNKIRDAFYLPAWCSTADYVRLTESLSLQVTKIILTKANQLFLLPIYKCCLFALLLLSSVWQDIKAADWSQYVAPFWPAVIRSALTWKGLTSLLRAGKSLNIFIFNLI